MLLALVAGPAAAVTSAQRAEQVRYATETVTLGNYQFMQRKANFLANDKFSSWTQYANLQACFTEADIMWSAVRLANSWA